MQSLHLEKDCDDSCLHVFHMHLAPLSINLLQPDRSNVSRLKTFWLPSLSDCSTGCIHAGLDASVLLDWPSACRPSRPKDLSIPSDSIDIPDLYLTTCCFHWHKCMPCIPRRLDWVEEQHWLPCISQLLWMLKCTVCTWSHQAWPYQDCLSHGVEAYPAQFPFLRQVT